jgi:triosephosphate isomerase
MIQKYYFANWKMFQSFEACTKFIDDWNGYNFVVPSRKIVGIAPSYEQIYYVRQALQKNNIFIGSQDCSEHLLGAYTSQVSVQSLVQIGIHFSILGHSEVRSYLGQQDHTVALKFKLLLAANISPIICIGESLQQKKDGYTFQILYDQLQLIFDILQNYQGTTPIFIAYEPIYAIGTGYIPETKDLVEIFAFLQSLMQELPVAKNIRFLYGGSVSHTTVMQFADINFLSGFLIGKSSIDFQELKKIVELS